MGGVLICWCGRYRLIDDSVVTLLFCAEWKCRAICVAHRLRSAEQATRALVDLRCTEQATADTVALRRTAEKAAATVVLWLLATEKASHRAS